MKTKLYGRNSLAIAASTTLLLGIFPFASAHAASTAFLSPSAGAGVYSGWVNPGAVVNEAVGCTGIDGSAWRGDNLDTRNSAGISSLATVPDGSTITSVDVQVCQQRAAGGADGATFQTFILVNASLTDSGVNVVAATPVGSPVAVTQNIVVAGGIVKSNATTLNVGARKTNGNTALVRVETIAARINFTLPGSTTTVNCTTPISFGSTSACTATVAPSAGASVPTGAVNWTASSGSFSNTSCTPGVASQTCTATFTPTGVGAPTVTATYPGDSNMTGSFDDTDVTVNQAASTTTVSCASPIVTGSTSLCTATVSPSGATGSVSWTDSDGGSFSATSCTTAPLVCSATFTPLGAGTPVVTATYPGDNNVLGSNGTFTVTVNPPPPAPPPPSVVTPVPVFGPLALLLSMLSLGLIGGWQARRRV
jgi:hypothetical protein